MWPSSSILDGFELHVTSIFIQSWFDLNPSKPLSIQGGTAECAERSAAPPQVAPRAKLQIQVLAKYLQASAAQLQKPRPRISGLPPLYLSPGPRTFRRAGQKW